MVYARAFDDQVLAPVCVLRYLSIFYSPHLYGIGASRATTQLASSTAVLDDTISFRSGPGADEGVLPCQRGMSCSGSLF